QFIEEIRADYQSSVNMVTDAEIALYSIKRETDDSVIMVLGGTGSAVVLSENDESTMIGGFGHILGDEGSGYHLAITALKEIITQYEEGKKKTDLTLAILQEIKAKDHFEIKNFVYNKSKNEIARLSQFIAEYAINGNEEAIKLFKNEGVHLARQTLNAYNKLHIHNRVTIGIRGGFVLRAPFVKEALIEELNKYKLNYILDDLSLEPVYGAYYLGLRHLVKR
ncbi:MAG: hypothetical protein KJ847_07070, partial [Firmicutes bacterium]|nr:hypothetical protein [Bacillota bacterium]